MFDFMRNITIPEIHNLTFSHQSKCVFDHPDYEKILANVAADRHEKTLLGLWTTVNQSGTKDMMTETFGTHTYHVKLKPDAVILKVGGSELQNLYYQEGETTASLRAKWANVDMIWIDALEQIFLKFDKIEFTKVA